MSRRTKLNKKDWDFIKWIWDYKCVYCGSKKNLTKEHIIPISRGGPKTYLPNIIVACNNCNSTRSSKPIEKFVSLELLKSIKAYQLLMSAKYKNTQNLMKQIKEETEIEKQISNLHWLKILNCKK